MPYSSKVVLQLPLSAHDKLAPFVEQCVTDAVELICVAGPMADEIEDQIDWLVVADGSDADRFIVTTAHPDEPLDRALAHPNHGVSKRHPLTLNPDHPSGTGQLFTSATPPQKPDRQH